MEHRSFFAIAVLTAVLVVAASVAFNPDEFRRRAEPLMAGTAHETGLYVLDSGRPGATVLVLAGVHGNEPGAWQAAEALLAQDVRPEHGKLLVIPRANALAVAAGIRSTPEQGDLNRLYFGDADIFPMARMAQEITEIIERYEIDVILDLHESWAFHPQTAGEVKNSELGQTISPHPAEPGRSLTRALVEATNARLPDAERFHYHEFPPGHVDPLIVPLPEGVPESAVPRKSGLELPERYPALASVLVEVAQQQPMDRRVAQQIAVVEALIELVNGSPDSLPVVSDDGLARSR